MNIGAPPLRYNRISIHFDVDVLPAMLQAWLPNGPLALADFGCGDGPLFAALDRGGFIGPGKVAYAVDMEPERLSRIKSRFPYVDTIVGSVDEVPLPDATLDFVISTMVMEHVADERAYLDEIRRVLRPGGRAYITTVYKRHWAWYFRKRDGKSVLDETHLREYVDLAQFEELLMEQDRFVRLLALEVEPLLVPILDPLLFRLLPRKGSFARSRMLGLLRQIKVRIPGYFSLNAVVER